MFEKINAETGKYGDGGEYVIQTGFGWTNGAVIDLLVNLNVFYEAENKSGNIFLSFMLLLLCIQ